MEGKKRKEKDERRGEVKEEKRGEAIIFTSSYATSANMLMRGRISTVVNIGANFVTHARSGNRLD